VVSALPIASFAMDSARLYPTGPMAIMITSNTIYSPASAIPSIFQGTPFYSQTGSHRLLIANNWTAANPYGNGTYSDQTYPLLPTNGETFTNANSVKFVDLDLDGYQDLVIGDSYTGNVMIWRGTASGNFIDVTSTAIPYGIQGSGGGETVRQILAAPLSESNLGLQDLFLVRTGGGSRILINHSDVQNHKILLVDETTTYTGQPNERLANPPNGISAVIANLDCTGGPDIYMLDDNGGEHFFSNSSCLQGGNCGFFTDLTNQTGVLPPQSLGSQCVGTDCGGNVKVLPINYDSGNTDLFIARSSAAWTVRPHRLLQNNCGSFTDVTLATWSPMPADDDALSLDGALIGDIFGHAQQGQTGNIQDLLILSNYAPRIYENTP